MADPIEAHYTPDGDDWTVAVTGRGKTLTGRAPGLIAARDRADQLVEQLAPEEVGHKTVVHMLNGDAVDFTTAYLTARLARTEEPPLEVPADETEPAAEETEPPAADETTEDKAPGVPAPAKSTEGEKPAEVKPTPAPRTGSEAAQPAAQPATAEAPETASSNS
jgi:hypothetical protein